VTARVDAPVALVVGEDVVERVGQRHAGERAHDRGDQEREDPHASPPR
jgi:hypothetical protein